MWQIRARDALEAMVGGNHWEAMTAVKALLESEEPQESIPGAVLLWIDSLFAVFPPPRPAFVPDTFPGANERQMWGLRMMAARANDDRDQAEHVFAEATSGDFDRLIEYLAELLTMIAQRLRGLNGDGARRN